MDKLRDMLSRTMHPKAGVLATCVVATAVLDAFVFVTGNDLAWWAYPVYTFSAYTLLAVIVAIVPVAHRIWRRIVAHPRIALFAQSEVARAAA